jgi:hypothetical protein
MHYDIAEVLIFFFLPLKTANALHCMSKINKQRLIWLAQPTLGALEIR